MKTTIESLIFPSELKNKLNMKVGKSNLDISFINGHIINIDKTNLSITEPHKIIVNNKINYNFPKSLYYTYKCPKVRRLSILF